MHTVYILSCWAYFSILPSQYPSRSHCFGGFSSFAASIIQYYSFMFRRCVVLFRNLKIRSLSAWTTAYDNVYDEYIFGCHTCVYGMRDSLFANLRNSFAAIGDRMYILVGLVLCQKATKNDSKHVSACHNHSLVVVVVLIHRCCFTFTHHSHVVYTMTIILNMI